MTREVTAVKYLNYTPVKLRLFSIFISESRQSLFLPFFFKYIFNFWIITNTNNWNNHISEHFSTYMSISRSSLRAQIFRPCATSKLCLVIHKNRSISLIIVENYWKNIKHAVSNLHRSGSVDVWGGYWIKYIDPAGSCIWCTRVHLVDWNKIIVLRRKLFPKRTIPNGHCTGEKENKWIYILPVLVFGIQEVMRYEISTNVISYTEAISI